jgi:V/A-type H+/Na+-transporting ATPase subunit C
MSQVPLKDYAYGNARVKAMTGRLLDPLKFDALLAAPDFNHFLSELDDTQYGPYIEEAVIEGLRPTNIDRAFNRNIVYEFTKIRNFFEGRPYELVGILLSRWDLYNLKTILRGKQALIPNSEIIRALVPMGDLDEVLLEEIVNQPDFRASVDAMVMFGHNWKIKYGSAINSKLHDYFHEHDLAILELAMDRLHYRTVSEEAEGNDSSSVKVFKVIKLEIGAINHVTLLRLSGKDMGRDQLKDYYLPGGDMSFGQFARLAAMKDEESVVRELSTGPFREVLDTAMGELDEKGYGIFQDELEKFMIRCAVRLDDNPLDIGVIIRYMWRKYMEVANLRVIMRGKSIGMIESQIRKEMIDLEREKEKREAKAG